MSITSQRRTTRAGVAPWLRVLSCRQLNPASCADHPDDAVCLARGDGVDAGAGNSVGGGKSGVASCTSNAQCTSPTPICDTTRSMCVQCTADQPGACGGTTPACGDDDTCRGCVMDSACEALTCLPEGACEPAIRGPDGGPASLLGGVRILVSDVGGPAGRFVFACNTVALDVGIPSSPGQAAGLRCTYASALPLVLTSNVVVDNSTFSPGPQCMAANCSLAYSDVLADTVALPGAGDLLVDPRFVDVLHGDVHLQAASSVQSAADPAAALADDIHGDARPQGAGRDMGADEIQ